MLCFGFIIYRNNKSFKPWRSTCSRFREQSVAVDVHNRNPCGDCLRKFCSTYLRFCEKEVRKFIVSCGTISCAVPSRKRHNSQSYLIKIKHNECRINKDNVKGSAGFTLATHSVVLQKKFLVKCIEIEVIEWVEFVQTVSCCTLFTSK